MGLSKLQEIISLVFSCCCCCCFPFVIIILFVIYILESEYKLYEFSDVV